MKTFVSLVKTPIILLFSILQNKIQMTIISMESYLFNIFPNNCLQRIYKYRVESLYFISIALFLKRVSRQPAIKNQSVQIKT